MKIHWRALITGIVGAMGGLGAVSLMAQDRGLPNATDLLVPSGDHSVWHAANGSLRHCIYDTTYGSMSCTRWQ